MHSPTPPRNLWTLHVSRTITLQDSKTTCNTSLISMSYRRKKSLLIGINYVGSSHELRGCHSDVDNMAEFLSYRGYTNSHNDRVILSDRPEVPQDSPYYPTGHNILAAMDWLVSEPGCTLFLHYSGHGGQVKDVDQNRSTGLDDSLVPVDYETRGQLSSTLLHEHLVTRMAPDCTLFIIMDCCHSGSAVELPYVFRTNSDGQISLMDNLKAGARLVTEAQFLFQDGFSYRKVGEAQELLAGASSFFKGLKHLGEQEEEEGLSGGEFAGQYGSEKKMVTMFSGCRDDQTSADAQIQGEPTGAMTWAFLEVMKRDETPTYAETLTLTRQILDQSNYSQIPQLSSGLDIDLDHMALVL
ncbi:hypothetical protein NX059_010655 [Plenodomus lindquistii]|nr:hypothetical protein NX059_010655 [Plenodomus lindquistii]